MFTSSTTLRTSNADLVYPRNTQNSSSDVFDGTTTITTAPATIVLASCSVAKKRDFRYKHTGQSAPATPSAFIASISINRIVCSAG